MILDARKIPAGTTLECQTCVIGGGAAGVTAFLELASHGRDVVLLEGGGTRREPLMQDTYRGEIPDVEPQSDVVGAGGSHPPLDSTREKKLGGTSSWGGRCAPLDSVDFEPRQGLTDTGWPIGRDDLTPYYERANRYLQAGRFAYTSKASGLGADSFLLRGGTDRCVEDTKIFRYSPPTHFGKTYRRDLHRASQQVFHHANALCLECAPDRMAVASVIVASRPGQHFRVVANDFIVACGGLESARLLMASNNHAGTPLGAGDDALGRYYMTHLDAIVGTVRFTGPAPLAAYSYELSDDGVYCRRLLTVREDVQRAEALLNVGAAFFMPHPKDPSHRDGLLSAYALSKEVLYRARMGFKSRRYGRYGLNEERIQAKRHMVNVAREPWRIAKFAGTWATGRSLARRKLPSFLSEVSSGSYRIHFNGEQSPSRDNCVELADQVDEFGIPRLRVRWHVRESDYDSISRSLGIMGAALGRLRHEVRVPSTAEGLFDAMGGGFLAGTHAMGTTRMGTDPTSSVVNPECRVHGLQNLYIASSSVFPTGGFAPPTLTIVALAIRVADFIRSGRGQVQQAFAAG